MRDYTDDPRSTEQLEEQGIPVIDLNRKRETALSELRTGQEEVLKKQQSDIQKLQMQLQSEKQKVDMVKQILVPTKMQSRSVTPPTVSRRQEYLRQKRKQREKSLLQRGLGL